MFENNCDQTINDINYVSTCGSERSRSDVFFQTVELKLFVISQKTSIYFRVIIVEKNNREDISEKSFICYNVTSVPAGIGERAST